MEGYYKQHKELGKYQREYRRHLKNVKSRNDTIKEATTQKSIEKDRDEADELRAKIWVANGAVYRKQNERHLQDIKCHVECQENLARDIKDIKRSIANVEREIKLENKRIGELNRLTIPDQQQQQHDNKVRRKLKVLENTLEAGERQEGIFTALNTELREKLICLFHNRATFQESYSKMIHKLTDDKKFMFELIEYVITTVEGCIDIYEKNTMLQRRYEKELELRKFEMKSTIQRLDIEEAVKHFVDTKNKSRIQADMEPKELKRCEKFRRQHQEEIDVCFSVMKKLFAFTETNSVEQLIQMFERQENLYYSFYKYANEMGYHIVRLNNGVESLYKEIILRKKDIVGAISDDLSQIDDLERKIKLKEKSIVKLEVIKLQNDEGLEDLVNIIQWLCDTTGLNSKPLRNMIGNHEFVDVINYNRFLKLLEYRIKDITAAVYATEREKNVPNRYVVTNIERLCERPTELNDIVLTQQCPECVEGEEFNVDDHAQAIGVSTMDEAKEKLYEKITQPEIQYRLHSISQCHLARSRLLVAKREL